MDNNIPDVSFTEEGRELEYFIFKEYKKEIMNSTKISEESKLMQIKLYENYIKAYEECYKEYREERLSLSN